MSSRLARSHLRQRQYQPHHTGRRDALLLTDRLGVDVHRRANISMAKKFLVDLHVHPELPKHRGVLHLVYSFSLADDPLRATLGHSHFDAIYLRDRKMPFISKEFRSLMLEIWHLKILHMPDFEHKGTELFADEGHLAITQIDCVKVGVAEGGA